MNSQTCSRAYSPSDLSSAACSQGVHLENSEAIHAFSSASLVAESTMCDSCSVDFRVHGSIMKQPGFSAEELRTVVSYNPHTGEFRWLVHTRHTHPDVPVGGLGTNGYQQISINSRRYYAHHLAWYFMTGTWPNEQVDHANREKTDNRWCNLRLASSAQNTWNQAARPSQFPRGVCKQRSGRFQSKIYASGKWKCLGTYNTQDEAHEVYKAASRALRGEFSPC